jgi:hypothetical protein
VVRLRERDGVVIPVRLDFSGALEATFQLRADASS